MTQRGWKASANCAVLTVIAFALCVLLSFKAPNVVWEIKPEYNPAPPADEGPAQSKGAIRDPAYLPAQIAAIVGSYVATLIIVCIALLTIGRRLRRATQASPGTLAMEIMKPVPINQPSTDNPWGPSPVSPAKTSLRWPSPKIMQGGWGSLSKHKYQESVKSVATFDESVIEEDRQKNEMEMDRLYAAVAQHEAQRERTSQTSTAAEPLHSPLAQHPPELQHLRSGPPVPTSPTSTRIPIQQNRYGQQYQPTPPPTTDLPALPPSRGSTKSPGSRRLHKPSPITLSNPPSRTSSSRSSWASIGRSKKSPSIRDLPISPPLPLEPDWESEPPTPRAPPSAPPHQAAFESVQLEGGRRFHFAPSVHSVRSPTSSTGPSPSQTPRTATFPVQAPPAIREQPSQEDPRRHMEREKAVEGYQGFNFQLDAASSHSPSPPPSVRSGRGAGARSKPAPLPLTTPSSQGQPPLRTAPLPLRALRSPNSQRPPSMIKATEVERPERRPRNNLLSPGTAGVPVTPYSPYMPMTPLTPMTPSRLVTREERKRMKKEEGRRVLTEADRVPEESEMWGDAY